MLPARLARRVTSLASAIEPMPGGGPTADIAHLTKLADASDGFEVAELRYRDSAGHDSLRQVEPMGIVCAESRWYLVCWDRARSDWRTLRVDRIDAVRLTGEAFVARALPRDERARRRRRRPAPDSPEPIPSRSDLAAFVSRRISTQVYRVQAQIVLHAPVEAMRERISPLAGRLVAIDAGRCRLQAGANGLSGLAAWLLSLGVDFEIESPAALSETLRGIRERLDRLAAGQ